MNWPVILSAMAVSGSATLALTVRSRNAQYAWIAAAMVAVTAFILALS